MPRVHVHTGTRVVLKSLNAGRSLLRESVLHACVVMRHARIAVADLREFADVVVGVGLQIGIGARWRRPQCQIFNADKEWIDGSIPYDRYGEVFGTGRSA